MMKLVKLAAGATMAIALTAASAASASDLYACVALFDVKQDQKSQFQARVLASSQTLSAKSGFVTERVLRNLDPYSNQFALYSRFSSRRMAEHRCNVSFDGLANMLERAPEVHVAEVTSAYNSSGRITEPGGLEFGAGRVGQVAHLGLFLPFSDHRAEYDRILDIVKMNTVERNNQGYLGEDLLAELSPADIEKQSPYSPRPSELVPMSINYGEYATFEDAENAYVRRGEDSTGDAKIRYWYRAFYGALQVPHRFYIYEVIGNYPDEHVLAQKKREKASSPSALGQP